MMCEQELQYWDWLAKVTEKLTFIRLKVGDRKDIGEEDYNLLRELFPVWYNGNFLIYQTKMEGLPITATQSTIFDAVLSDNTGGINIVYESAEPKEIKE